MTSDPPGAGADERSGPEAADENPGPDAASDEGSGPDEGEDADTDPGTDADADPGTDADADPGTDPEADPDADFDVPPWSIWYAVRLMWAGAVLSLLGLVVSFLTIDEVKRQIAADLRDQHKFSQHEVDTIAQNLLASTVLGSLLATAMWLWMARANGAGKKWARAIATTLGGLNVTWFAVSFSAEGATVPQLVLAGASVVLAVAILALIWHPDSGDYYWYKSKRR